MRETVKTICFDQWGRILLVHEKGDPGWQCNNGKKPGWGMSGGGPENGESSESAAIRETREESGLITQPKKKLFSESAGTGNNHQVSVFYSIIVGGSLKKESLETDGAEWFFYDELPEMPDKIQSIYSADKRRIKKAIEILDVEEELKWLKWYFLTKEEEKNAVINSEISVAD